MNSKVILKFTDTFGFIIILAFLGHSSFLVISNQSTSKLNQIGY